MKYSVLFVEFLLLILVLNSCETKQEIPTKDEITEIIVETIKQDSLDKNTPICLNLVNRYIYQQEYNKDFGELPLPPRNEKGQPFVFGYYKSTKDNSLGFNQKDSIFTTRQVNENKNITLELKMIPENINIKNVLDLKNDEQKLYKFLVPLFNNNKDFAIVEYDFQCPSCGYGIIVFLRKIAGKWTKIKSFGTWTS